MRITIERLISTFQRCVRGHVVLAVVVAAVASCAVESRNVFCTPGQTEVCETACGQGLRSCDNDGLWTNCAPTEDHDCLPGDTGTCEPSEEGVPARWSCTEECEIGPCEPTCEPGTRIECETDCGRGARHCSDDGTWGRCTEYLIPECRLGEIHVCSEGGYQRCDATCSLSDCVVEDSCSPGEIALCPGCGYQRCRDSGRWSTCNAECYPGDEEICNAGIPNYIGGATRTCTPTCMWSECTPTGVPSP